MMMNYISPDFNEIRDKANVVRNIDLKSILNFTGAVQDKYDKNKWHTPKGVISITGTKFMNWNQGIGGGGAIDLILHLKNIDFKTAVRWLSENFPGPYIKTYIEIKSSPKQSLKLPEKDDSKLPRVIAYLLNKRHIPLSLIESLIKAGNLYADIRGNAVFLLLGKRKKIVGAELRGTGSANWRGMAPGSRKDLGYFFIKRYLTRKIVLCESAIDAISCFCIHPDCLVISTSGAHPNPAWLENLIEHNYEIYCGFDSDKTGDKMAKKMIAFYPNVKRLRPGKHDWNNLLIAKS